MSPLDFAIIPRRRRLRRLLNRCARYCCRHSVSGKRAVVELTPGRYPTYRISGEYYCLEERDRRVCTGSDKHSLPHQRHLRLYRDHIQFVVGRLLALYRNRLYAIRSRLKSHVIAPDQDTLDACNVRFNPFTADGVKALHFAILA